MADDFYLHNVSPETLDTIIGLPIEQKITYFNSLMEKFYPSIEVNSEEYDSIIELYISSFYLEKIYRNNRFLNESFILVYTKTGLIKNMIAERYFIQDDLIIH